MELQQHSGIRSGAKLLRHSPRSGQMDNSGLALGLVLNQTLFTVMGKIVPNLTLHVDVSLDPISLSMLMCYLTQAQIPIHSA
jgi:hypothetical protein